MNCQEVREILESKRGDFSEAVKAHISGCGECRSFSTEENQLDSLLNSLPSEAVPNDFNQTVRSRIVESNSNGKDWRLWIGVAVPAAAVCLILGFVFLSPYSNTTEVSVPDIAKSAEEVKKDVTDSSSPVEGIEPANNSIEIKDPTENIKQVPADELASGKPDEAASAPVPKNEDKEPVSDSGEKIMSKDFTAKEPEVVKPPGLDGGKVDRNTAVRRSISAREALEALGINTVPAGSGLRVSGVVRSSLGEKSGIRKDDVIVALDGRSIRTPVESGIVRGKSVTILRDGKRLRISLRN